MLSDKRQKDYSSNKMRAFNYNTIPKRNPVTGGESNFRELWWGEGVLYPPFCVPPPNPTKPLRYVDDSMTSVSFREMPCKNRRLRVKTKNIKEKRKEVKQNPRQLANPYYEWGTNGQLLDRVAGSQRANRSEVSGKSANNQQNLFMSSVENDTPLWKFNLCRRKRLLFFQKLGRSQASRSGSDGPRRVAKAFSLSDHIARFPLTSVFDARSSALPTPPAITRSGLWPPRSPILPIRGEGFYFSLVSEVASCGGGLLCGLSVTGHLSKADHAASEKGSSTGNLWTQISPFEICLHDKKVHPSSSPCIFK
ncbi:hypothetical protein CEXT_108501 [Caerostris extrusa]|uniref:Uncharacterized protein n=1 Tax=Caerostris extrusa TaxID=172846 RepID=A0AAV4SSC6_CAEEX|nr:hypothetical protein CEXT_108501 [Caerostris extrusa]